RCCFHVWAPRCGQVMLHLLGPDRLVPMQPIGHGWHEVIVDEVQPGRRYLYRVTGGRDRPDPASRSQPDGVHGPSEVIDPACDWHDQDWRGIDLADLILYELHVGTFTPVGTLDAVIGQLDRLIDVGVNAIEVMPVAQFPGRRNWGYDGVYPFCVQSSYGGAARLKRLGDSAHQRGGAPGLGVGLNPPRPEGHYLPQVWPYFPAQSRPPGGDHFNFDGPGCAAVRDYFLANAAMWQTEFHLDGLRLDAVPFIKDFSASHILADMADQARELQRQTGRRFHLIG